MQRRIHQLSWICAILSFLFWHFEISVSGRVESECVQSILVITPFTIHSKDLDKLGEPFIALLRHKYEEIEKKLGKWTWNFREQFWFAIFMQIPKMIFTTNILKILTNILNTFLEDFYE